MNEQAIRSVLAALVAAIEDDGAGGQCIGAAAMEQAQAAGLALDEPSRSGLANGLLSVVNEMLAKSSRAAIAAVQMCALARGLLGSSVELDDLPQLSQQAAAIIGQTTATELPLSAREKVAGSLSPMALRFGLK